jgi:hypothetical protein
MKFGLLTTAGAVSSKDRDTGSELPAPLRSSQNSVATLQITGLYGNQRFAKSACPCNMLFRIFSSKRP